MSKSFRRIASGFVMASALGAVAAVNAQKPALPRARIHRSAAGKKDPAAGPAVIFPFGTATPSAFCGECHEAIYNEHAFGFGADLKFKPIVLKSASEPPASIPSNHADSGTAHHLAGVDPWPILARNAENGGQSCNFCHFPEAFEIPDINAPAIAKPVARPPGLEAGGVTCASCHLTPDGKIRASHEVVAPHETVVEPKLRTSAMCAYCHSAGKRVIGKQTQTFYEWRDDFFNAGLGQQQCENCHMPRTVRSVAEGYNVPPRTVGRHLWTGDHSFQRMSQGLGLEILKVPEAEPQAEFSVPELELHVINVSAGHSMPTGSNRRALYLQAEIVDGSGNVAARREWMFAPWYGDRPDDRAFLEEDKKLPDAISAMQADAQGPHEAPVRAGEDRVLTWRPELTPGQYTFQAKLVYDLNRYNDRAFQDDQTELHRVSRSIQVP